MELTFNKAEIGYLAEHSASTSFNLHIEGGGRTLIQRRTSGEHGVIIASIPAEVVDVDIVVDFPATYTIVVMRRAEVTITTKDGEVISGVMPEEDTPSDAPSGYETFDATDGAFEAADGYFYVKL